MYTNSEQIFNKLTNTIGFFCKEATGREVDVGDESNTIPKLSGEFIFIELMSSDQLDWSANEWVDDKGKIVVTHNYETTFSITAYRGNAHAAITRVLQCMNLPFMYNKYFPEGAPYAYASSSTVSRMRVPLNAQAYENRARVLITFNVCVVEHDTGDFGNLEKVIIGATVYGQDHGVIDQQTIEVDTSKDQGA